MFKLLIMIVLGYVISSIIDTDVTFSIFYCIDA